MPQLKIQWKHYLRPWLPYQWKVLENGYFISWWDCIYCKWRSAYTMEEQRERKWWRKRVREQASWYQTSLMNIRNAFLALTNEKHQAANVTNHSIRPHAQEYVKARKGIGHGRSSLLKCKWGCWDQISQRRRLASYWVFDHSSCHVAIADDALDVNAMNVKPGGQQWIMRDNICNGKEWCMYTTTYVGWNQSCLIVLEEHGMSTAGRGADWMHGMLSKHSDFRDEKS